VYYDYLVFYKLILFALRKINDIFEPIKSLDLLGVASSGKISLVPYMPLIEKYYKM
jgi:hypothetical protein